MGGPLGHGKRGIAGHVFFAPLADQLEKTQGQCQIVLPGVLQLTRTETALAEYCTGVAIIVSNRSTQSTCPEARPLIATGERVALDRGDGAIVKVQPGVELCV